MKKLIIGWILCGFLSYGSSFAYDQQHFPCESKQYYYADMFINATLSLFGPISLASSIVIRATIENVPIKDWCIQDSGENSNSKYVKWYAFKVY